MRQPARSTDHGATVPRRFAPSDDTLYETARGIWNGMVARRPGLIARCADVADVQAAVRACASAEVSTAVRCGGHSLAGFSTCEGGVVIDLSKMRQITVDRAARRARFAGAHSFVQLTFATQKGGLAFPAGVVSIPVRPDWSWVEDSAG